MEKVQIKLTILFDDAFWIGFFERTTQDKLEVAKVTFGAEPKEIEILEYILYKYKYKYIKFSESKQIKTKQTAANPKRMKRLVKKQTIGKKSWDALKEQQEKNKIIKKINNKEQREEKKQIKFELKQKKKQEKHKGK